MILMKVFIVLIGVCCIGLAKITVEKYDKNVLLEECVEEIVLSYSNQTDTIIYLNLDENGQNMDINTLPAIKMNTLEAIESFQHIKPGWYILTMNEEQILTVLSNLMLTDNWNCEAKFVIIYTGDVKSLLYWLERFYILNVVILSEREGTIDISTYFPYNSERSHSLIVKGNCTNANLLRYLDLYATKLPYQWKNTTINVMFDYYPPYVVIENHELTGIDINIFQLVRNKIGFKTNFIQGMQFLNCSGGSCYFDPVKELQNKIGIFLTLSSQTLPYKESSVPFLYDTLQWVVPVADLEITWYRLVNIFNYSIWLSLMAVVIIGPFAFYFMAVQERDVVNYRRFPECIMMIVQCLIGQPVNIMPTRNSVRIILVGFLMFSCVVITAYQSRLLWDFYDESKQISTVQETLDNHLKVGFSTGFDSYFSHKDDKIGNHILAIRETCYSDDCLNRSVTEKTFVTFDSKRFTLYMNNKYFLGKNNESQIYFLKDGLIQYSVRMKFMKGFPLTHCINKVLYELQEHGITQYLSEKLDFAAERPIERALEMQYAPHTMNLKKLKGAFWLLLVGWTVSIIALACEILYNRYTLRRN